MFSTFPPTAPKLYDQPVPLIHIAGVRIYQRRRGGRTGAKVWLLFMMNDFMSWASPILRYRDDYFTVIS